MSTSKFKSLCQSSNKFGETNDCTVKAVAVVTGLPYEICHEAVKRRGRRNRKGAYPHQYHSALRDLGYKVEKQQLDPRAKTMKSVTKYLPSTGKFLINVSRHVAGATGRLIHDWADGTCRRIISVHAVTKVADVDLSIFSTKPIAPRPRPVMPTTGGISFKMKPTQIALMQVFEGGQNSNGVTLREWSEIAQVSYGSLTRFVGARKGQKRRENDAKYGFASLVTMGKIELRNGKYFPNA